MASRYESRRSHSPSNDGFPSHVVIDASTPPRIGAAPPPPPPRVGKTTTPASGAAATELGPAAAASTPAAGNGDVNPATSLVDRASRAPALTERAGRIYNLWLAHARGLYGFCTTHMLEWPSMTVQWLPDSRREIPARDYSMAQLVVGTAAPIGAPNWVGVHQVFLHCDLDDEHEQDLNVDDVERFEGIAHNFRDVAPLMQRHSRFMTGGPVLRVRPMPSRPQLLAVRTRTSPDTLLVDFSRRRAEPEEGNTSPSPDLLLKGHRGSGRAMAWCEQVASRLATGGADNLVNVYWLGSLVEGAGRGGTTIQQPGMTLRGHTDVIDDISWHGSHGAVLSSCSRAGELILWDLRASKQDVQHERPHGSAPVYATQFHPTAHFMLATGGADNTTRVWDIRKFKEPCAALVGHSDAVRGVEWAPFNETVLLSYSADGSTRCWDLAKRFSSTTQQGDDTRDARASLGDDRVCSADLVFTHAGHTAGVREAAWAPFPEDEWTVASVCDNNMLQLWTPHPDTYNDEVVGEEDEDVT